MRKVRRWEVLSRLINEKGYTTLVELGVFRGDTLKHLLRECPNLRYAGVDLFTHKDASLDVPDHLKKTPDDTGYRSYINFPLQEFRQNAERIQSQNPSRVQIIIKDTCAAAADFADASIDLVFIDADHTPEGVEADIRAWAPKIRAGGLLTGHDENMPCIREVLQRLVPGYTTYDDSVWVIPVEAINL